MQRLRQRQYGEYIVRYRCEQMDTRFQIMETEESQRLEDRETEVQTQKEEKRTSRQMVLRQEG